MGHKGTKKQEDEDRSYGMYPGCGGEEEIISSIRKWIEERYELLFTCVCMFERGGVPLDG